jgi:hypothetical protein
MPNPASGEARSSCTPKSRRTFAAGSQEIDSRAPDKHSNNRPTRDCHDRPLPGTCFLRASVCIVDNRPAFTRTGCHRDNKLQPNIGSAFQVLKQAAGIVPDVERSNPRVVSSPDAHPHLALEIDVGMVDLLLTEDLGRLVGIVC